MRLVFITQDFPPEFGGIQTYSWELARRLAVSCERFAVIAPGAADSEATDRGAGFRILRAPGGSDRLPAACVPALRRLLRRDGFDVVLHAQWQTALATAGLRQAGLLRRLYVAAHGRELLLAPLSRLGPAQRLYDGVRGRCLRAADRLFPVSRYTAGLLVAAGAAPERVMTIPNGTDCDFFRPGGGPELRQKRQLGDGFLIVSAGRLVSRKGFDTVLRALPAVRRRCRVRYAVLGDGPERQSLEQLTRRLGLADVVSFHGRVPRQELPRWYSAADVFVTPSRLEPPSVEGFGLVFLEAGACGTAVIGSTSGGIPDAIEEGVNGYLVEPDDAEALTRRLLALARNPDLAQDLGERGRRRVREQFTWDIAHDRLRGAMLAADNGALSSARP